MWLYNKHPKTTVKHSSEPRRVVLAKVKHSSEPSSVVLANGGWSAGTQNAMLNS